jgi:hypothetical protein
VGVLGAAPLCFIHGAIAKNILFEDGDGAHTFHVFNSTQVFLHLKNKMLLTCCGAQVHILVIILLRSCVFF